MSKYFNVNHADQDLTFIIQKSGYGKHVRDLEKRIDKAIEYINTNKPYWEEWHYDDIPMDKYIDEILDILKGSDNNE